MVSLGSPGAPVSDRQDPSDPLDALLGPEESRFSVFPQSPSCRCFGGHCPCAVPIVSHATPHHIFAFSLYTQQKSQCWAFFPHVQLIRDLHTAGWLPHCWMADPFHTCPGGLWSTPRTWAVLPVPRTRSIRARGTGSSISSMGCRRLTPPVAILRESTLSLRVHICGDLWAFPPPGHHCQHSAQALVCTWLLGQDRAALPCPQATAPSSTPDLPNSPPSPEAPLRVSKSGQEIHISGKFPSEAGE